MNAEPECDGRGKLGIATSEKAEGKKSKSAREDADTDEQMYSDRRKLHATQQGHDDESDGQDGRKSIWNLHGQKVIASCDRDDDRENSREGGDEYSKHGQIPN